LFLYLPKGNIIGFLRIIMEKRDISNLYFVSFVSVVVIYILMSIANSHRLSMID